MNKLFIVCRKYRFKNYKLIFKFEMCNHDCLKFMDKICKKLIKRSNLINKHFKTNYTKRFYGIMISCKKNCYLHNFLFLCFDVYKI